MKVLLDENLDHGLRKLLGSHVVSTTAYMGWAGVKNGELLRLAEASGFDVLLTGDQTLYSEEHPVGLRLAIVALTAIKLPIIRENLKAIISAIDNATPGSYQEVNCGNFSRKRNPQS